MVRRTRVLRIRAVASLAGGQALSLLSSHLDLSLVKIRNVDARGKPSTVFPRGGLVETERTFPFGIVSLSLHLQHVSSYPL